VDAMSRPSSLYPQRFRWLRDRIRGTGIHDVYRYVESAIGARRSREMLSEVRTYCLFIGHARSGHSIVGALLDAHPAAVVSDELDAVRYFRRGFSRDQLYRLSIDRAARQARNERRKRGRHGKTYSYFVPGQWQGRFRDLKVVGDSTAGETVRALDADPRLLGAIRDRMRPADVRVIHVVRNPFDNISTMIIRGGRSFDVAIRRYFENCDMLQRQRTAIGGASLATLRHEDLVTDPRTQLAELCRFLELDPDPSYLEGCAAILFSAPSRTRSSIEWTPERIAEVTERMAAYDFLAGYGYAE
jgi:hypothetical protein